MTPAIDQTGEEATVRQAVEAFRKAMLASDRAQLDALTADQLSYGHSNGRVENKAECVANAAASRWKVVSLSDLTASVVGDTAVSRSIFTLQAETAPKATTLGILMVWLKQDGHWKLLARQAVRV